MSLLLRDFVTTTLSSAPSGTAGTSLTVQAGAGGQFPVMVPGTKVPAVIEAADGSAREAVMCTARTGDTFTIVRSASPVSWSGAGQNFYLTLTAAAVAEMLRASLHTVVPTGGLTATNVQAALEELDTEVAAAAGTLGTLATNVATLTTTKAALESPVFTGTVQVPTAVSDSSPVRLDQVNAFLDILRAERRGAIFISNAASFPGALQCSGGLFSKETYAALWAWAQARGVVVPEASHAALPGLFADYDATQFRVPRLSGYVVRAHHNGDSADPDFATRLLGSVQGDAIRNIEASTSLSVNTGGFVSNTGAFLASGGPGLVEGGGRYPEGVRSLIFDASRTVPTAAENRMKNISLNFYVYF